MNNIMLRDINFGRVFCSSGSLGFFGDGYWYHKWLRSIGLNYEGATFIAKTTTLAPRVGNMLLQQDGVTPKHLKPSCIKIDFGHDAVLNAVGLSGPGLIDLLKSGRWQKRTRPFLISLMSIRDNLHDRLDEAHAFAAQLVPYLKELTPNMGIEINFSCPNVGLQTNHSSLVYEVNSVLDILASLNVPLIPNFGPDVDSDAILEIATHKACDAISIANTVKWGRIPHQIQWHKLWGGKSPLEHLGGGGLSGAPLFPVVRRLVKEIIGLGLRKPLIAGGGILSRDDASELMTLGAAGIKLGTVGMLKPWRVQGIIRYINEL
jgi:dihydroorotate dehydrogenase